MVVPFGVLITPLRCVPARRGWSACVVGRDATDLTPTALRVSSAPSRPQGDSLPSLPYEPVLCKACRAVLNPYCSCDYHAKVRLAHARCCLAFINGA